MVSLLFFFNIIISSILLGLILVIQFVHYPSFYFIAKKDFDLFTRHHSKSISLIVIPLMLFEASLAFALVFLSSQLELTLFNLSLVLFIWMSTFCLSVPCHQKLNDGKNTKTIEKLIITNWPRTILWAIKLGLAVWMSKDHLDLF